MSQQVHSSTILVVDDEILMRDVLQLLLSEHYIVLTAENGKVALNLLSEWHIDVVLTDFDMPSMDGEELIRAIRQRFHQPTIVLMSAGYPGKIFAEKNGISFFGKPFKLDAVLNAIREALEAHTMLEK